MNSKQYYANLRAKQEELTTENASAFRLVISVYNLEKNSTGGNISEVTVANAARLLVDGTHRLATTDEAAEHVRRQEAEHNRLSSASHIQQARKAFNLRSTK